MHYRITELLSIEKRKTKEESVIMSKLEYCLEATSTGRKKVLRSTARYGIPGSQMGTGEEETRLVTYGGP